MKSIEFISQQYSKLVNEVITFYQLPSDRIIDITGGTQMDKEKAFQFVKFKRDLLILMEKSDEKALVERYDITRSRMCEDCKKELPDGTPKCIKDFYDFITCCWITYYINIKEIVIV